MSLRRVKIHVDSTFSGKNRRSWLLFDAEKCRIVSDLSYLIVKRFRLVHTNVLLKLDGYVLPPSENIDIVRDNDSLTVTVSPLSIVDQNSPSKGKENRKAIRRHNGAKVIQPVVVLSQTNSDIEQELSSGSSSTSTSSSNSSSSSSSSSSSTSEDKVDDFFLPQTSIIKKNTIKKDVAKLKKQSVPHVDKVKQKVSPSVHISCGPRGRGPPKTRQQAAIMKITTVKSNTGSGTHIRFNDDSGSGNSTDAAGDETEAAHCPELATAVSINVRDEKMDVEEAAGEFVQLAINSFQPKIGDRLKYKVLELSPEYTPILSSYKEGSVTSFNLLSQTVTMLLSKQTMDTELKRIKDCCNGKFSLSDEMEEDSIESSVEVKLSEMVDPWIYIINE